MKRVYVDLARCLGCKTCEIACAVAHSRGRRPGQPLMLDLYAAIADPAARPRVRVVPVSQAYYPQITLPIQCRHCEKPQCVAACVTGALTRDAKGRVNLAPERCIGCRMCVMLCPYGAIRVDPVMGVALKCDLCPEEPEPACVSSCPTKALIYAEEEELVGAKHRRVAGTLAEAIPPAPGTVIVGLGGGAQA